ncbi:MAG: cytochrome c bioproteinis protein CcmG thiol:disulfide interchange protein DsbE [Rhodospirillaceae bacterium]|nr:MAG: cytochrome c bioproteinis protein CcmG thiol:disulfide interchange protein DsbE [Rhodospirillaceae bacterium]
MRPALIVPLVVFLGLVSVFMLRLIALGEGETPNRLPSVLIDRPVPAFALPELPGRGRPLRSEDLKGQVSLVNIFGSWCVACLVEHPFLMRIKRLVPIHGIDWRDKAEQGAAWLRRQGDPYDRVGWDPDSRVAIDFGVTGAPETFIVDAAGMIRYKHIGPVTPKVWEETLWPLIERLRRP